MIIDIIYQHIIKTENCHFYQEKQSFLNPLTRKTYPKYILDMKKICDKQGTNVKYLFLLDINYSEVTYWNKKMCDITHHLVFLAIVS